jgi:hypothetical protein
MRRNDIAESTGPRDCRVSAARAGSDASPAVLLSFSIEITSARRVELQRIIGVLLPKSGPPAELAEPEAWLRLAEPDRAIPPEGEWQRAFASWVPKRTRQAEKVAAATGDRMAAEFVTAQRHAAEREAADLQRWLRLRADDICGVYAPRTADLFGLAPTLPGWKSLSAPLDRLAAFAADTDNPPARRREANSAVALFQRRREEREKSSTLMSPARVRPIGMLLLVPDGSGG